jgi:hypothetical protein
MLVAGANEGRIVRLALRSFPFVSETMVMRLWRAQRVWEAMRPIARLLAVVALMLIGAPVADGEPTLVTNVHPLVGLVGQLAVVGSTTLVAGSEGSVESSDVSVVRSFAAGRRPSVLVRVEIRPGNPEGVSNSLAFAASPARIVALDQGSWTTYKGTGWSRVSRVEAGPLGARLQQLTGECPLSNTQFAGYEEGGSPWDHSAVALDGEVLAYDSYYCLFVADLSAPGTARVIALPAPLEPIEQERLAKKYVRHTGWETPLRVAGRLVAYRANPPTAGANAAVVVYDIDSGRVLYSVPLPAEDEIGEFAIGPSFEVQSDGTLVIADARTCTASVSTIAQPVPHPLGIPACAVRGLHEGRALLVVPGPARHRLLAWSPLESPFAHLIADVGRFGVLEAAPAVTDGASVVYAMAGCEAESIYRAPLSQPGMPPAVASSCPVRIGGHATLTAKGLSVHLRCPLGCEGHVESLFGTRTQLRRGRGQPLPEPFPSQSTAEPLGEPPAASYSLTPGQGTMLKLVPAEYVGALKRALAHYRSRLVKLELSTETPTSRSALAGEDARKLGVVTPRRRNLVIPIDVRLHAGR